MIFFHKFTKFTEKLYVRATFAAVIAIFSALSSSIWGHLIPDHLTELLGANSVDVILPIIASNMLVVVTFSLATMVAGYSAASQGVTPRAARILIENQRSQNAISIFLGAFIFSIVSLIALSTEIYGRGGRFILFVLTCLLLFLIVWMIIRWIEDLSKLGRVHETIVKIERSAHSAFNKNGKNPTNWCKTFLKSPSSLVFVRSNKVGYIQSIDFEKLNQLASKIGAEFYIQVGPGTFAHENCDVVGIKATSSHFGRGEIDKKINNCLVVDDARSFECDPRFNLIVLSEVASRALSPGVNDPGTAIDALTSVTKVFYHWISLKNQRNIEVKYPQLFVHELTFDECFEDFFKPISRDGAEYIEVLIRLLKSLESIESMDNGAGALTRALAPYKKMTLSRGLQCLKFQEDKDFLQETYNKLFADQN